MTSPFHLVRNSPCSAAEDSISPGTATPCFRDSEIAEKRLRISPQSRIRCWQMALPISTVDTVPDHGNDTDIFVSSAKAYLAALNRLIAFREITAGKAAEKTRGASQAATPERREPAPSAV